MALPRPHLDRGLNEQEIISVGSNVFINTEGIFFGWFLNTHANSGGWFGNVFATEIEANAALFESISVTQFAGINIASSNSYLSGNSSSNTTQNSSGFFKDGVEITSGGGAAGANTQIQFNDSGEFGGSDGFTFNKTTNVVHVGNSTVNAVVNSTLIRVGNSTVNTTVTPLSFFRSGNEVGMPPGFYSVRVAQAADTDHDVTFSVGRARDSTDVADIILTSAITKQIDAAWAVGTNAGGLDTGTVTTNSFYYLWVIKRSDTGVVDALFSLSATAPTMPANYDLKQRVGWVRTNASSNILAFVQDPVNIQKILYVVTIEDVDTSQTSSSTTRTLTLPPNSTALMRVTAFESDANFSFIIRPLTETDAAPSENAVPGVSLNGRTVAGDDTTDAAEFEVGLNGSSQLATRASTTIEIQIVSKGALLGGITP